MPRRRLPLTPTEERVRSPMERGYRTHDISRELGTAAATAKMLASRVRNAIAREAEGGRIGLEALTGRERQVCRFLGDGLRHPDIAERLGVGVPTVEGYVRSVVRKLGLNSRWDLVPRPELAQDPRHTPREAEALPPLREGAD